MSDWTVTIDIRALLVSLAWIIVVMIVVIVIEDRLAQVVSRLTVDFCSASLYGAGL